MEPLNESTVSLFTHRRVRNLAILFSLLATLIAIGSFALPFVSPEVSDATPPAPLPKFLVLGVRCPTGLRGNIGVEVTALRDGKPYELGGKFSGPDGYAAFPFDFSEYGDSVHVRLTYDSLLGKWQSRQFRFEVHRNSVVRDTLVLSWADAFPGKPCFQREKKEPEKPCIPSGVLSDARGLAADRDWDETMDLLRPYVTCIERNLEASLLYGQSTFMDDDDRFASAETFVQPVAGMLGQEMNNNTPSKNRLRESAWYYLALIRVKKFEETGEHKAEARATARAYLRLFGVEASDNIGEEHLKDLCRRLGLSVDEVMERVDEISDLLSELD